MHASSCQTCVRRARGNVVRNSGLGRLISMVLATCIFVACDSAKDVPVPPNLSEPVPLTSQVQASWSRTDPGAGGFRRLPGWDQPKSLYATAWNLCLRETYGIGTPSLSVRATATWLRLALTNQDDRSMPPLQRAWLVAHGLRWLHQALPREELQGMVDARRSGDLFAFAPNEQPSWAATQVALEVYDAIGVEPPPSIRARVRADINALTSGATNDNFLSSVLPIWSIADKLVSSTERSRVSSALSRTLQAERSRMGVAPTGASITVLRAIYQIAKENQIELLPPVETISFSAPAAGDGYLSLFGDRGAPDPQITCVAGGLGFHPPRQLFDTVARTAQSAGWTQWPANPPDPQSSLFALLALRALGSPWNEDALKSQVLIWLRSISNHSDDPSPGVLQSWFYIVALALELGVTPPPWMLTAVSKLMDTDNAHLDAWVLALASLLGINASGHDAVTTRVTAIDPSTMGEAWQLELAGRVARQPSWHVRAKQVAQDLRAVPGAFSRSARTTVPDLLSTAAGLELLHADLAERVRAVSLFGTYPRFWIWPPDTGPGNVSDPQSLYLGLLASGSYTDATGLVLAMFT